MAVAEKRICVIGAPQRDDSGVWLDAIAARPELRVNALVEAPSQEHPPTLCDRPVFASVPEMLASGAAPELALLLDAPAGRVASAEPLLLAGTDLLVAAPLATTRSDCERLTERAERLGRVLISRGLVASPRAVRAVRRALADGAIGAVHGLEIDLGRKRDARHAWQAEPDLSGGGVWMDLGPAALELATALLGPLARVRVHGTQRCQNAEVEDDAQVELRHECGAHTRLRLSWNEERGGALARVRGESGSITIGPLRALLRDAGGGARPIGPGFDAREAAGAAIDDLLARRLRPDAICDEGCEWLEWVHAGYRSEAQGRWQPA